MKGGQRLDEMRRGADGPLVRSRLVAMEVARGIRFDTFAGTLPLKCIKIIISRAVSIKNERGRHTRVLAPARHQRFVLARTASYHTMSQLRCIRRVVKRRRDACGKIKRAMYETRRASRLLQEHMKGFLGEAGYAALKVCHQCRARQFESSG